VGRQQPDTSHARADHPPTRLVLSFLRAERYSGRYGEYVDAALAGQSHLLEEPDLDDPDENVARKAALAKYRGYGADAWLFKGFPSEVEWWLVTLSRAEVSGLYYGHGVWSHIVSGEHRVSDGVRALRLLEVKEPETYAAISAVIEGLRSGQTFERIIVAAESPQARHVLVEGYSRATAFSAALGDDTEVEVFAGYSPDMHDWFFYCDPTNP
jgi:hypothetical protein